MRAVTLSPQLLWELKPWRRACPKPERDYPMQDLVFPNSIGHCESCHNLLSRHLRGALKRARLKPIRFHDLRHTCISMFVARGKAPSSIAKQVGHSNASITLNVYTHDSGRVRRVPTCFRTYGVVGGGW
jgi:integrase